MIPVAQMGYICGHEMRGRRVFKIQNNPFGLMKRGNMGMNMRHSSVNRCMLVACKYLGFKNDLHPALSA